MASAKDVEVRVIPAKVANPFVKAHHYSGKVVTNSQLHLGAFLNGRLHGVMSFGPPMDKSKVLHLVKGTPWNGMLELNRMAFDEVLPKNSESRCKSVAMRLIRKNAPHVKWILSYADGCQCGDGAIYRASGFLLTGISENSTIAILPDGTEVANMSCNAHVNQPRRELGGKSLAEYFNGRYTWNKYLEATGAKMAKGYMLRYIYFIDKKWRDRLTVPEIPFSKIEEMGAGMYKGEKK